MAVSANELGVSRPQRSTVEQVIFPQVKAYIDKGIGSDVLVELLNPEENQWLSQARISKLHKEPVPTPDSKKTFPHLFGFSPTRGRNRTTR
jgi:hypothetical protein